MLTFRRPGGTQLSPSLHGGGPLVPNLSTSTTPPSGGSSGGGGGSGGSGALVQYPPAGKTYPVPTSLGFGPIQTTPLNITFSGSGQGTGSSLLVPDTLWQGGSQEYRTSHVFRDGNGNLVVRAALRNDATDSDPNPATAAWVSGHVSAQTQWTMGYGRLEVVGKLPANGPGLVPAIWTLGVDYPNCMEYDLVETNSDFPTQVSVHYVPHAHDSASNSDILLDGAHSTTTVSDTSQNFHTYWWFREPNHVQMGVDNTVTLDVTPANAHNAAWDIFESPQYLIFNVAVNFFGNPVNGSTTWPGDMLISSVKYTPLTS